MTIDIKESRVIGNELQLWLSWTLATMAGMLFGLLPFLLLLESLDLWLARILVPLWAGFLVGVLQWLVLRRYFTTSADWILNGGAGWALGYALGLVLIQTLGETRLGELAGYLLFGLIIALVQWPVLRREIPNPLPWVVASLAGWALGSYASQALLGLLTGSAPISQALSSTVISGGTGLVAGALTGLVLVWIVRQPDR